MTRWGSGMLRLGVVAAVACLSASCVMVGPDYVRPPAPTADQWAEAAPAIRRAPTDYSKWWEVFADPVLDRLVETAYRQNPTVRLAGLRVLEAQARRGIAIGSLFPQQQGGFGSYRRVELSRNRANQGNPALSSNFDDWQVGFDAAWELDVWGKFRRGIEEADAGLIASVADYDDVIVSLIAEVAATYAQIRILEERKAITEANVAVQRRSYEIADVKFRHGTVTELDVAQARSLLSGTEALLPEIGANRRQAQYSLSVLLGLPPQDLQAMLEGPLTIPTAPRQVAVGIPAELLRRRPDIRRAERELAAQSARIGIAAADLYPQLSLVGNISLTAEDFADVFEGDSFEGFGGPNFRWAILNYGRIRNNIRVQDARYQQFIAAYENAVLRAQQEVESAIAGFLGAADQVKFRTESVAASERAVYLANIQYRDGEVDYSRVLNSQQLLLVEQEQLVGVRGSVVLNLIALFKALGGGWELREGRDFVDGETAKTMRARTNWDGLLEAESREAAVNEAAAGTERDRGWWRWRWWWPPW